MRIHFCKIVLFGLVSWSACTEPVEQSVDANDAVSNPQPSEDEILGGVFDIADIEGDWLVSSMTTIVDGEELTLNRTVEGVGIRGDVSIAGSVGQGESYMRSVVVMDNVAQAPIESGLSLLTLDEGTLISEREGMVSVFNVALFGDELVFDLESEDERSTDLNAPKKIRMTRLSTSWSSLFSNKEYTISNHAFATPFDGWSGDANRVVDRPNLMCGVDPLSEWPEQEWARTGYSFRCDSFSVCTFWVETHGFSDADCTTSLGLRNQEQLDIYVEASAGEVAFWTEESELWVGNSSDPEPFYAAFDVSTADGHIHLSRKECLPFAACIFGIVSLELKL